MRKRIKSITFLSLFLLVLISCKNTANMQSQEIKNYTAKDFHQWVIDTRSSIESKRISPDIFNDILEHRMENDIHTYDGSILEIVRAWRYYEKDQVISGKTITLINQLQDDTQDRKTLTATFNLIKGEIYENTGEIDKATASFAEAVDDFHELHLFIDSNRIYTMLKLGQQLYKVGNKEKAETVFLDILSYPWHLIQDIGTQQPLKEHYIQAGIGLIDCRRGDLEGLNDIYFFPSVNDILTPILDKAKKEATN